MIDFTVFFKIIAKFASKLTENGRFKSCKRVLRSI